MQCTQESERERVLLNERKRQLVTKIKLSKVRYVCVLSMNDTLHWQMRINSTQVEMHFHNCVRVCVCFILQVPPFAASKMPQKRNRIHVTLDFIFLSGSHTHCEIFVFILLCIMHTLQPFQCSAAAAAERAVSKTIFTGCTCYENS